MARKKMPENLLSEEQKKRQVRNDKYRERLKKNQEINKENIYKFPDRNPSSPTISSVLKNEKDCLKWSQIESVFLSPEASVLAILITIFSSYLIYQGTVFFQNMGINFLESALSSFFGEILCITTAGLFVVSNTRFSKFLSGFILLFSVVFLALFLHRGVENQLQKSTPKYKRLEQSFSELKQEIKELREEKKQMPHNFVSKKEKKQTEINSKLKEKNQLSIELSYLEKGSSLGVSGYYNAWLRIALMLINVLLVHRFFVCF